MSGAEGHYYEADGTPRYVIAMKDGRTRPTDLRDAKKLLLKPSVTTVLGIIYKYPLVQWQIEQGVRAAYEFDSSLYENEDDYLHAVMQSLRERSGERTGSAEGAAIHSAIEAECKGAEYPDEYQPHVQAALNEVATLFPDVDDWASEVTFAHPMGFAGKTDLPSPSTGILVDFKTSEFMLDANGNPVTSEGKKKRLDWDQHSQLAAYQRGMKLPCNVAANVFISRTHPGTVWSRVWTLDELAKGWDIFRLAFGLWVQVNSYDPSFTSASEGWAE